MKFSNSLDICRKPCKYKKYTFVGGHYPSSGFKSEHFIYSLGAVSGKIKVQTEEVIYPNSTLVAEFGGTLGLFIGFSLISLWDCISAFKNPVVSNV